MEFGARRAQGDTAACVGAKHAYIGGVAGTSCYETGKKYGIPVLAKLPIDPQLTKHCDQGTIELFEGEWLQSAAEKIADMQ